MAPTQPELTSNDGITSYESTTGGQPAAETAAYKKWLDLLYWTLTAALAIMAIYYFLHAKEVPNGGNLYF